MNLTPEEAIIQFMFYVGLFWGLAYLFNIIARYFALLLNRVFGWG